MSLLRRKEAAKRGFACLLTEHLLLALLRDADTDAARVLAYCGIARDELRLALEAKLETFGPPFAGESALSPRLVVALERAQAEAASFGQKFSGAEHLLLGLIAEGNGLAARLLARQNLTLERAREAVIEALWDGRDVRIKEVLPRVSASLYTPVNVVADQELTQAIATIYRSERWGWNVLPSEWIGAVWGAITLFLLSRFLLLSGEHSPDLLDGFLLLLMTGGFISRINSLNRERTAAYFLIFSQSKHAIRPLIRILHWHDAKLRAGAAEALTRLLPTIQANDSEILTPNDRIALGAKLHPRNVRKNPEFVLAILAAFERVGFGSSIPHVKPLTLRQPKTPTETRIYEAANRCLRALEWRAAHQDAHWTLLRPSGSAADSPDILLRPASAAGTADPATLLRPAESPEPKIPQNPTKETP